MIKQAISERDSPLLLRVLGAEEGIIGHQALHAVISLNKDELYQYLDLMIRENVFWRNLNFETGEASELQGKHQATIASGITGMIQRDVTVQDLYDPVKRKKIQQIIADIAQNGLSKRDPNWKPKEWVADASPKKTIVIEDSFKVSGETDLPHVDRSSSRASEQAAPSSEFTSVTQKAKPILLWAVAVAVVLGCSAFIAKKITEKKNR